MCYTADVHSSSRIAVGVGRDSGLIKPRLCSQCHATHINSRPLQCYIATPGLTEYGLRYAYWRSLLWRFQLRHILSRVFVVYGRRTICGRQTEQVHIQDFLIGGTK